MENYDESSLLICRYIEVTVELSINVASFVVLVSINF